MSVQRTTARINGTDQHFAGAQKDFLDQLIEKKKEADWIDDNQVIGWLCVNVSERRAAATSSRTTKGF